MVKFVERTVGINHKNYTLRGIIRSKHHSVEDNTVGNRENTEVSKNTLLRRLKRVEGQIRGIQKMIAEDRDCANIVMQLAAVRSGIEGVGALVLNNCMKLCFHKGPDASKDIDSLTRAMAIWGRVRSGEDK